ncbi:sperm-associated antigen 1-like [Homalodisca vitripennis]|uniref:sperm-associated antigen 1-like n=1 Tax=Homalodisca vitripennis TaxID=197043 RepID=UPI001EEA20F6|nr:sperm-associated antigen 1-like [Homalodisca vitripennis]KAG8309843.1 Sperm associated antigen 1 [Homalodisca vitripennis]
MNDNEKNLEASQMESTLKQRSLLRKYEIPIDYLSYEYIGRCNDVKQLERIVKILRSGEEGFYPDLQKATEDRLRLLNPVSRQLRIEEPVLTRNSLNREEWNTILTDISMWQKEISVSDMTLSEENNKLEDAIEAPIRQAPVLESSVKNKCTESKRKVNRVSDYKAWDKYDADTELLKMDLKQEQEDTSQKKSQQTTVERIKVVENDIENLSQIERQLLAEQEKNRGNEYYEEKNYDEAIKYYTASIAIWPTPKAYNNRSACYLKQCNYTAALADAKNTLNLDPNNVKALFRRGIALQHKNQFREALADMNKVLEEQPKHILAQNVAQELRKQINTAPESVVLMTDERLNKPKKVTEVSSETMKNDTVKENTCEVLPKVMFKSNSKHNSVKYINEPRNQLHSTVEAKVVELSAEDNIREPSTRLKIIEVDNS